MNSASRGLWPVVGLRRPGEDPFASAEADAWRAAPGEADFNRRQGLRPTIGLRRSGEDPFASAEADAWRASALRGRFQSASKAFGRWSACADREKIPLRRRRPTPGAERLERPISIGTKAFGRWVACADRESVLCVGGGRRPARQRLERPISIGVKGLRLVGRLRRPGEDPFASAEADARRAAP
jgi:hypothetical protein